MPVLDTTAAATPESATWRPETFVARLGLGNGHLMTVFAWAHRRTFPDLPEPEARLIRVSADTQVRADCFWQPERQAHPTLVALHGLEGSSAVHYMRGLADKGRRLGWNVVLLNQRNCGGTEHLTPSLYHSGLTDDPRAVIRSLATSEGLTAFGVVGYSLGGNLAMKLAGELAQHPELPVLATVAVCPTIDLARCVAAIERRRNIIYEFNFVRNLKARMRRKDLAWPGAFDLGPLDRIRTIREFDDRYTAPHHGFGDAPTYYHRASALRVADRIRVPTLVLSAEDDPFVPTSQFADPAIRDNPQVRVRLSPRGGHCAFVTTRGLDDDGYWAEAEALRFLSAFIPVSGFAASRPR
jgi:predicted alpha/beta-fold hydrolase